jgi:cell division septum initiation protein DivIVA
MSIEGKMVIERVEHERLVDIEKKYHALVKKHERLKKQIAKLKEQVPPSQKKKSISGTKKKKPTAKLSEVLS